jgi:hypothetical protein
VDYHNLKTKLQTPELIPSQTLVFTSLYIFYSISKIRLLACGTCRRKIAARGLQCSEALFATSDPNLPESSSESIKLND